MNDNHAPKDKVQALREAMREEMDATNTYETLKSIIPKYADIFDEIKKDEVNHTGRLLDLIVKLDPGEMESLNKGMAQEE